MARARNVCLFVTLLAVLVLSLGSSAWAASLSGTVYNGTGKTGRIYLSVNSQNGSSNLGTSVASTGTSTAFTINGVQTGVQYSVQAFVDTQGYGLQHANDPSGTSVTKMVGSGGYSVTVTNPSPVPAQAPDVMVAPGNGGNFVFVMGAEDDNGHPVADKYKVSWSASPGGDVIDSKDIQSGDKSFFAHIGGSSALYYQVTAFAGGTSAPSGWVQGTATVGTGSVTGKIFYPGSATAPLFVILVHDSDNGPVFNFAAVANHASGGSYTASNVAAGSYSVYPVLDLNGNGIFDTGDLSQFDNNDFSTTVTVSTSQATAPDITLSDVNAIAQVSTNHQKGPWGESYNINLNFQSVKKQVVKVQVVSGPGISGPIDLGLDKSDFSLWLGVPSRPAVGDAYQVTLTYQDGTPPETVPVLVSAVLDGFATPLAPVGLIPFNATPTFSWSAPSPAPAEYNYNLWLSDSNYNGVWDAWGISSSQTSMVYGSQGDVYQSQLSDGTTYNWNITVTDRNGNQAQSQVSFTPTSAPALGGFSPAGGLAGTKVTITGINLVPDPSLYTVLFNGVTATVSAATSTSLTVTVPEGASTGRIQVNAGANIPLSASDFTVAAPVTIAGVIKTSGNVPIAGAIVEKDGDPTIYTTTAADGSFTLDRLFLNQYVGLKISKSGYVPTYTTYYYLQDNLDLSPYPYHLCTQAELTSWGVAAGKGVFVGQVLNSGTTPYSPVGGVTVTADSNSVIYPVTYYSGTAFGGTSTYANGIFVVPNVAPYQWVNLNASKSLWSFQNSGFSPRADSVSEGGLIGSTQPPYFWGFSPTSGKAGTSVVLTGSNFSSIFAENSVKFNGAAATVTAATPGSLTVTVPAGATTGPISVTTEGGTATIGYLNFTMRYTLSASVTGSGSALGTATSVPGGISCRATGCTAEFEQGTPVQIIATADAGSVLSSWGGACTGTGTCSFTMNADTTVSATFGQLQYIRNGTNYYSLLQAAFDGAANGTTIEAQAQVFSDTGLTFNRPAMQVKFKGGYDSSFLPNSGFTVLDGRLDIQGGTLRVEKFKVK
jgi:uncharacterized protein (DUF2141 family)